MLWPIELPMQITLALCVAFVLLVTISAPRLKWDPPKACFISIVAAVLLFIPSCTAIMAVIDEYRFGVFEYAKHQDINDDRVDRWIPSAATEITLEKVGTGFRARFKIAQDDLDSWLNNYWTEHGADSFIQRSETDGAVQDLDDHHQSITWFGEDVPSEMKVYQGPTAPNGAGFTIYYHPPTQTAFERAGYW